MMFPSVWSSLLMVNKQALGTLVSLLMVILAGLWDTGMLWIPADRGIAGNEGKGPGSLPPAPRGLIRV